MQEERESFNRGFFGLYGVMAGCCALPFILALLAFLAFAFFSLIGSLSR